MESEEKNTDKIDLDQLAISPIAVPMASEKMTKKLLTLIAKLSKLRLIKRGVKEVNKYFRKKDFKHKSFCVLAGDVSPVDVISHIPILCEKNKVPYIYIPSRQLLGMASSTKRPTSVVVLIDPPEEHKYHEKFETLMGFVKKYDENVDEDVQDQDE